MPLVSGYLNTSPTVKEVRKKIDAFYAAIRTLEDYCSSRVFVLRLPCEVLSMIFEYAALPEPYNPSVSWDPIRRNPYAGWLSITRVCRLWRNIAINSPRLWTSIYSDSPLALARTFLYHSKSAPLYLKSYADTPRMDVIALCLNHFAGHLKGIEFVHSSNWIPLIETMKAPNLETLVLHTPEPTSLHFAPEVDPGHIPHLREVKLTNCYFALQLPFLSQLRTLHIQYDEDTAFQPMPDVLFALKEMPSLESLKLVNFLSSTAGIPENLRLELPLLKDLTLKVRNPRAMLMLTIFDCPNIRSIVVDTTKMVTKRNSARKCVTALSSILPGPPSSIKLQVVLHSDKIASTIFIKSDSTPDSSYTKAQLTLHGPTDFSGCLAIVSPFPETLLTFLDCNLGQNLDVDHDIDYQALRTFTRTLDYVERIVADSIEDLCVLIADVPTLDEIYQALDDNDVPPDFSFPSVKHMHVVHAGSFMFCEASYLAIRDSLQERRRIGLDTIEVLSVPADLLVDYLRPEVHWLGRITFDAAVEPF
ncbi:hypothetical protein ONZ45_g16020 [Pleurotus djamor]|nr:hypothetical protein ONZ45_g16020 [Pleurotus djamor]